MNRSNGVGRVRGEYDGLSRVRTEYESAGARQHREKREQEDAVSLKSIRAQRKRLKKKHRGSTWIGGKLYRCGRQVAGTPELPKPRMPAIGLDAQKVFIPEGRPDSSWRRVQERPYWDRMGPRLDEDNDYIPPCATGAGQQRRGSWSDEEDFI